MKKTVLTAVTASLLVGFLTYYWCRITHQKEVKIPPKSESEICINYTDEEESTLSVGLIYNMTNHYRENKRKNWYSRDGKKDTIYDAHSIWFDLETLKKFIYNIELSAEKKDSNYSSVENRLGIRIYYADYPERNTWNQEYSRDLSSFIGHPEADRVYENMHTLIMVPTKSKGNLNIDFDLDNPQISGRDILIRWHNQPDYRIQSLTFSNNFIRDFEESESWDAQNHGSMIPPANSELQEAFPNR